MKIKKNILITCGPTWVSIDDVRVISNHSSGEMGHLIAQEFIGQGAKVTLIEGPVTHVWNGKPAKVIKYQYFDELQKILNTELKKNYDVLVHAAAVSDFKVKNHPKGKISSTETPLMASLKWVPTPKLIEQFKKIAPQTKLIGFKLESNKKDALNSVSSLFEKAKCDLVVANTLKGGYQGFIIDKKQNILAKASSKRKLAEALVKLL